MPRIGREHTANIDKNELLEDRNHELNGYTVSFMDILEDVELGELLKGLPNDMCQSHHWGVVEAGEAFFRYSDGSSEAIHAGEAFYIHPGHAPRMAAGTKVIMFSPAEEMALTNAAIQRNLEARG